MKTSILSIPSSNYHPQTVSKSGKRKYAVAMALIFFSSTQFDVSADFTSVQVPQRQPIPSGLNEFAVTTTPPSIPSTESYQVCLSKAMDIIESGDCNDTSNIIFCIKAEFIATSDNCALYL